MRSFDERRTEIFRRSAQRIQKRRRTARFAMLCIPLVLCLSVVTLLLPQQGVSLPDAESSLTASEIAVEIQQENSAFYRESTDTKQILTLSNALQDAMALDFSDGFTEESATATQNNVLNTDQIPTATQRTDNQPHTVQTYSKPIGSIVEYGCYIITFTTRDGNTTTYRLGNKTLTKTTTSQTVTLTDETAAALRALVEQLT